MTYTFRLLTITRHIKKYPEYASESLEFPYLIKHVEDEVERFVYCNETKDWW